MQRLTYRGFKWKIAVFIHTSTRLHSVSPKWRYHTGDRSRRSYQAGVQPGATFGKGSSPDVCPGPFFHLFNCPLEIFDRQGVKDIKKKSVSEQGKARAFRKTFFFFKNGFIEKSLAWKWNLEKVRRGIGGRRGVRFSWFNRVYEKNFCLCN